MFKTQKYQYCQNVNSPPNEEFFNLNKNAIKFLFKFLLNFDKQTNGTK